MERTGPRPSRQCGTRTPRSLPLRRLAARHPTGLGSHRAAAAGARLRLLPEQKLRGRLGVAGLGLCAHRRQRCDRESGRLHRRRTGFLGEAPAHEQHRRLELVLGTAGERLRPQETAVGLGAFRTGRGPDLPQRTPRQRDQPRFGEVEHRFVGGRNFRCLGEVGPAGANGSSTGLTLRLAK